MFSLRPEHLRAARYLLGWTRQELADHAMLSETTLRNFEGGRTTRLQRRTVRDILATLEKHGVIFDETDDRAVRVVCSDGVIARRADTTTRSP